MKVLKNNALSVLINLVLVAVFLPACNNTNAQKHNESGIEKPEMNIHAAVLTDDLAAVRQHIKSGTDINEIEPMSGSTPLISAATFGKTDIAKALIEAGADLTITNNDGATPLHSAAFFCRVEIVQLLIDVNADKTLRNKFGATPEKRLWRHFPRSSPFMK